MAHPNVCYYLLEKIVMGFHDLEINKRKIRLHSAINNPNLAAPKILVSDPWEFVSLWLRRNNQKDAIFYWEQANQFYQASSLLSSTAAPLTSYYCFLNASIALLLSKKLKFDRHHGVSGKNETRVDLKKEFTTIQTSGVLPAICRYMGNEIQEKETYSLYQIFEVLPFIHRTFTITFNRREELFIPVTKVRFVRKDNSNEAWFAMNIDRKNKEDSKNIKNNLLDIYEIDSGIKDELVIRTKNRFKFIGTNEKRENDILKIKTQNKKIRKSIVPIFANPNQWYLKKKRDSSYMVIDNRSILSLIFAGMHRLSELSRYNPPRLLKYDCSKSNWLIREFLNIAPPQFIIQIASEITGEEFVQPYARRLS